MVTNQSAVGRGMCSIEGVEAIHRLVRQRLAADGITIDAVYVCPHAPDAGCTCRKPQPGMILAAVHDLDLDLAASILIGDKASDVDAGRAAGVGRCVLIGQDRADLLSCASSLF